jgi:hypothetical protein
LKLEGRGEIVEPAPTTNAARIGAALAAAESDEPVEAPTPPAGTSGVVVAGGKRSPCTVGRMEQERRDDEKLVDQAVKDMGSDVDEMQERSEELGERVEETRSDWGSKQQDDAVPGAQPPPVDEAERPPGEEPADGGNGDSGQQQEQTSGEEQSEEQSE